MEVVLLLVAILGVALIAWPRIQRRRAGARKPAPARRRTSPRKARAQAATASPPVATWTPSSGDWDDDLGWEGVDSTAATPPVVEPDPEPEPEPERAPDREAWERFRATELSPEAKAEPVEEPALPEPGDELPSVERWREQRHPGGTDDWDDDGLGWEGESWSSGNGHAPLFPHREPEDSAPGDEGNGRAPFFAAHSDNGHAVASREDATPVVSPLITGLEPAPRVTPLVKPGPTEGREWVATDKWEAKPAPPETKTDGNGNGNGRGKAAVAAAPRGRRRLSPIVLVAIYAAAGIAVVILASTVLLGGSSTPTKAKATATPARTAAPKAQATPAATPVAATPTPDASVQRAEQAAKARHTFGGARRSALRAEHRAIARARAAYKRKLAALKRKQQQATAPAVQSPVATAVPATPRSYTPPPSTGGGHSSGGGGGGGGCEFCIG